MDRTRLLGLGFFAVTAVVVAVAVATSFLGEAEPKAALDTGSNGAVDVPVAKASGPGTGEKLGIRGFVEYVVYDADGNVKFESGRLNTTLDGFIDDAASLLSVAGTTTGAATLYDNIQLCSDNGSGLACTIVDLDEDSGAENNPAAATISSSVDAGGGDTVGTYEGVKTFTCIATGDNACTTIEEIQLAKGTISDGVASTQGAYQNVSTTLNDGDTIQITWTVDID